MSVENAKAFLSKLESDADLKAEIKAARPTSGDNAVFEVAKKAGLSFTQDDFNRALADNMPAGADDELDDDALEAVAGGAPTFTGTARRYEAYCS